MEPTPAAAPARDTERVAADVPVELARWTRRFAGQRQVATGKVTSVGSIVEEALEAHRARHETPPPVEPASAKGKR